MHDELGERLRRPLRRYAVTGLEHAARRLGYSVLQDGAVSPVPALPAYSDPSWTEPRPHPGVEIDLDAQLHFLETDLLGYVEEFGRDVRDVSFSLWNTLYQAGDAETLYALIRHLKPKRVVEIGSGNSTLVTSAACATNAAEGSPAEFVAIDPQARRPIDPALPGLTRFEQIDCRAASPELFSGLTAGDVLFIDTLHVVKRGSELNWLVLEVLPRLAPGVWIHLHDVFLPFDYPFWLYWLQIPTEQYLLQALLIDSPWRIELAMAALFLQRHERLTALVPSLRELVPDRPEVRTWWPSAVWIRKPEPGGDGRGS